MADNEFYNREKLYDEAWLELVIIVAKKYGVSEVALHKAARSIAAGSIDIYHYGKDVSRLSGIESPLDCYLL